MNKIANISYPKRKLLKKTDKELEYIFELDDGKTFSLKIEEFSKYLLLEVNLKNELILRKTNNSFIICDNLNLNSFREFKYKHKIINCFTLLNGNYLISTQTKENHHILVLIDKNLNIIKEQEIGLTSWHSQNSIAQNKDGIIMFGEYNVKKEPTKVSIYRSKDMGLNWEEVFFLNFPDEIRHWHTLQVDKNNHNHWLATSGDTPTQSRWFISKDNGNSWKEITDKNYKNIYIPAKSLSAHRTTCVCDEEDKYYWATDDLMGSVLDYFIIENGERKASSQFYTSPKTEPIQIQKLTNLGIHIRSIIDTNNGYLLFSEGKYVSYNTQVFYIDKINKTKAYFLLNIPFNEGHGGTYSINSKFLNDNFFIRHKLQKSFGTLRVFYKNIAKQSLSYNIEDYIKFEEHLWFLNKKNSIQNIVFSDNKVRIELKNQKEIFYMLLGDSKAESFQSKELFKLYSTQKKGNLEVDIDIPEQISIKIYLQFFNEIKKVFWKSFVLNKGLNKINFEIGKDCKYLKILFRIENKSGKKLIIYLKDLKFTYINDDNITSEKIEENIIVNFNKNDSNNSLFFLQSNQSTFETFIPRADSKAYKISYPLDWNINPFNDRNWCFQLHAWRMIDPLLLEYAKSRKIDLLNKCLVIINDWNKYTFEQKRETSFTWYDMATGLRALKLTYFANIIFNTPLERKIDIKSKKNILFLLKKHIEVLKKQNIAMNNHGLFQLHGLIVSSSLIEDKEGVEYGLRKIDTLIENQFYCDGFHIENSDKYHGFVLNIFKRIIKFSEYQNDKKLLNIIDKALYAWQFTVFPNSDPLLIGDTDYKIRQIEFNKSDNPNKYFMKFFKDSGYLFVRSSFSTKSTYASMLFFQTAYKNMTHRHSDDFNILLYEYEKNILVDSGQYSYDKNSLEREYVLSTSAHNCLEIDNQDYERKKPLYYESALKEHLEKNSIFFLKTFLERKDFDIKHSRIIIYKPKKFLIVIDYLQSDSNHNYSQYWHFHQDLEIKKQNDIYLSKINKEITMYIDSYSINLDNNLEHIKNNKLYKGQKEPELQGWRSLKYKELIPNYALENNIKAKNSILITKFNFDNNLELKIEIHQKKNLFFKSKNKLTCNIPSIDINFEL